MSEIMLDHDINDYKNYSIFCKAIRDKISIKHSSSKNDFKNSDLNKIVRKRNIMSNNTKMDIAPNENKPTLDLLRYPIESCSVIKWIYQNKLSIEKTVTL